MKKQALLLILVSIMFSGCIVGDAVALPFRVTGAVINVVAPDIVGDSISGTGEVLDTAIPF
ncbi:hypothetical protein HOK00_02575 [bacterium]|jgi:hypothetical protein|nr:hypothetical protein [bacterium]